MDYTRQEVEDLVDKIANKFGRTLYKIQMRYTRKIKKLEQENKKLKQMIKGR